MSTFVTANIKGAFEGMPQELVREDLLTIRDLKPAAAALQEFWRPRYNRAARNVFRPAGHRLRTPWYRSPSLTWSGHRFEAFGPRIYEPMHGIVPGRSDARQVLGQRVTERATGYPATLLSAHRAPGPWRDEHVEKLIALIDREVRAGRPVFLGADLNTYASKPLGDRIGGHVVRYVQHKVDFLVFVDSDLYGWSLDRDSRRVIPLHSDHDALAITATLRRRG